MSEVNLFFVLFNLDSLAKSLIFHNRLRDVIDFQGLVPVFRLHKQIFVPFSPRIAPLIVDHNQGLKSSKMLGVMLCDPLL